MDQPEHGLSSRERVIRRLVEDIQSGKIVPGQRLITGEVADEIGISHGPVREALHQLAGEGLLELMKNRGARVRQLSTVNLLEGVQILQSVGSLAIRLAAQREPTDQQLAELRAITVQIADAGAERDARKFFAAVSRSHRKMNEIAGNSFLNPVLNRLHLEIFNAQLAEIIPGNWETYVANYAELAQIALSGHSNYALLEKKLVAHFDWVLTLLQGRIDQGL